MHITSVNAHGFALAPSQFRRIYHLETSLELATCSDLRCSSLNYPLDRPGPYRLSAGGSRCEFRDLCPLLCCLAVTAPSFGRVLVWLRSLITVTAAKLRDVSRYGRFFLIVWQIRRTVAMISFVSHLTLRIRLAQKGGSLRVSIFNPLPIDSERLQADAGIHQVTEQCNTCLTCYLEHCKT